MKDLTQGNIYKTFIIFAIPIVLAGILSQGYHLIDTIIAGKYLGTKGLAAIGATSAFIQFLSSAFWGYGTGYAIYIAKLFGAGEYKHIKNSLYSNYIVLIAVMAFVGIISVVLKNVVFSFLQIEKDMYAEVFKYFSIYMLGFPIIILSANGLYIMNAIGASSFPFYMSVISAILNISGNIISVTVFKAGVAGIAISTVLASLTVSLSYFFKLRKCFVELGVDKEKFKFDFDYVNQAFGYSLPSCFQQSVMYVSTMLISPIVNSVGASAIASYTVVTKIYDINAAIYQNSAKTVTNYTAQCVGAKKYLQIKKGVAVGLVQGILFVLPCLLACTIFAPQVCRLFFPKGHTGQDLLYTIVFSRIYLPFVLLNLINNMFHAVARGCKSTNVLITSTVIGSVARYGASIILAKYYGIYGIYAGWAISWAVEAIYSFIMYFTGSWEPKEMKELENIVVSD